jgi:activating signal cointegrator 1
MKALTVQQPWAHLIAQGLKRIETRSWPTDHRGSLLIHAGSTIHRHASDLLRIDWHHLALQQFLAVVQVIDVVPIRSVTSNQAILENELRVDGFEFKCGVYKPQHYAWLLAAVVPVESPLMVVGRQRLWQYNGKVFDGKQQPEQ